MDNAMPDQDTVRQYTRTQARRAEDTRSLFRHPWFRKATACLATGATAAAAYFWDESRQALRDIDRNRTEIAAVQMDIRAFKAKVEDYTALSAQQRQEIRQDIARVESKVERLDERLSRWFDRADRASRARQ